MFVGVIFKRSIPILSRKSSSSSSSSPHSSFCSLKFLPDIKKYNIEEMDEHNNINDRTKTKESLSALILGLTTRSKTES